MIIGSFTELKVSQRYGTTTHESLSDKEGNYHRQQPFLVLRPATYDEYLAYCKDVCDGFPLPSETSNGPYFYEVAID